MSALVLRPAPDTLVEAQIYCERLNAEVARLRERWERLKADLQDCERQGYRADALAFIREWESRELT